MLVWSDNATNLVGTVNLWTTANKSKAPEVTAKLGDSGKLRLLSNVLMLKTLGKLSLTYEELLTSFADIESVLTIDR